MTPPTLVELNAIARWDFVTLPHASQPIAVHRLRVTEQRNAMTAVVQYPAGWEFRASGSYAADEELILLDGSLTVGGTTIRAGEYVFHPAGFFRSGTKTVTGALVLQRFSDPPRWVDADRPASRISQRSCFLPSVSFSDSTQSRLLKSSRGSVTKVVAKLEPFNVAEADTELFDPARRRWWYLPVGTPLPELLRAVVIAPAV